MHQLRFRAIRFSRYKNKKEAFARFLSLARVSSVLAVVAVAVPSCAFTLIAPNIYYYSVQSQLTCYLFFTLF